MYDLSAITTADYLFKTLAPRDSLSAISHDMRPHVLCIDPLSSESRSRNDIIYYNAKGPSHIPIDKVLLYLRLGDIQQGVHKNLCIHNIHYNPEISSVIAKTIPEKLESMKPLIYAAR